MPSQDSFLDFSLELFLISQYIWIIRFQPPKISEPVVETKENQRLKAKLDEVSRREQIKDMELAQLRAKVRLFERKLVLV